ncbi:hypothetical protein [Burkholderia cepacia]|uniref:hypothetical protein n=1 Tax=Burkholderia cepacia TaxID=292 RepID=UPI00158BCF00|nr:hypothetical protein [Burkholderia cepacia]
MSIWNLLTYQQKKNAEISIKELEKAISGIHGLEVYYDDHDYFYEIYVAFKDRVICSLYYEYSENLRDGVDIFTDIGRVTESHREMSGAVNTIIDYLKKEKFIKGDRK